MTHMAGSAEPSTATNPDGWGKVSHNHFGGHTYTLREGQLTTGRCEKGVLVSGTYVLYYICFRINHHIQTYARKYKIHAMVMVAIGIHFV